MLPYGAYDLVKVMKYELSPEDERRHGAQLARDAERDDHDEHTGPDKGLRSGVRLFFLPTAVATARGA